MAQVGTVPSEANSGATLNETPSQDQRSPDFNGPKTKGPAYDPSTKAYGRAEYKTNSGLVRRDR